MTYKNINFDAYQITAIQNEEVIDFHTILDKEKTEFNAFQVNTGSVIMMEKVKRDGIYSIMAAHNQMNDLPHVMNNMTGASRDLGLANSEGLAHRTCFVYDKSLKMLLVESTRNGVTLNSFVGLIQRASPGLKIETSFVINPDILQSFRNMSIIKRFEFRIAKVANGTIFSTKKRSLKSFTNSVAKSGLDKLLIDMRAGLTRSDSLNKRNIFEIINDLRAYFNSNEVQRVVVTGKESEEENQQVLDILSGRMRFRIRLEVQRNYSNIEIMSKCGLVIDKFNEKRTFLNSVYLQNGNQG